MHQSVATIDSPQFLNLQPLDINPLMSKCEIKVFYLGANRNGTFISEETAIEIGKTLRGAPIVGYYRDTKEDFTDHGEKVIIDDEGIKFECQTIPYGFVSPDAKVWFQNFEDVDDFGNSVVHKYMMTTGYLWTGQFAESSLPVDEGRPQSMELQGESVEGHWETDPSNGMDFFIINDAIIQKLCILGEDVEPCFEGASVTAPKVSNNFTLDDKFKHTLYSMMQDLKQALEGGQQMDNLKDSKDVTEVSVEEYAAVATETETEAEVTTLEQEDANQENETSVPAEEYTEENSSESENNNEESQEEVAENASNIESIEDTPQEDFSKRYEILEKELTELNEKYTKLQSEYQKLVDFKNEVDNQKKDELISEFYMLSEEDMKDVIQNKEKYSLDEIKAKLSVICFDKKINFNSTEEKVNEKAEDVVVYNLEKEDSNLPDWVKAVKEEAKKLD